MKKTLFALLLVIATIFLSSCSSKNPSIEQSESTTVTTTEPTDILSVSYKQAKNFAKVYTSSKDATKTYVEFLPKFKGYNIVISYADFSEVEQKIEQCFSVDNKHKPSVNDIYGNDYIKELIEKTKDKYPKMTDEDLEKFLSGEAIMQDGNKYITDTFEFKTENFKFKGYSFGMFKTVLFETDYSLTLCVIAYEYIGKTPSTTAANQTILDNS